MNKEKNPVNITFYILEYSSPFWLLANTQMVIYVLADKIVTHGLAQFIHP